jgi:malate dehydrogenase
VRSTVIIGAGELGGALARQLAAADVTSRIVLVDDAGRIAEGKALDISQAAPVDGYHTHITGTTDETAVVGAEVVAIADRAASGSEWQDDPGVALVRRVSYLNPGAMIVCLGARQLDVIERSVIEGGVPGARLVGSAPEALRAAVISMTALEAGCTPIEVSLMVLGRPPAQIIVPWEEASIAGRRAADVLSPAAITRLEARLPRLWPPGPFTLAAAGARLIRTAAMRDRLTISAFVAIARDAGEQGRVGMLPVHVHPAGIADVVALTLTSRDRARLDTALMR